MDRKEIICIVCPMGCQLEVSKDDISKSYIVKGNKCARGKEYGIKEMSNPTRVLTATVMLKNATKSVFHESMHLFPGIDSKLHE